MRRQVHEQEKKIQQLKELNKFLEEVSAFSPPTVRSQQRTNDEIHFTKETSDGKRHRKIAFYGSALSVSRQGFYKYLARRSYPGKLWRVGTGYTGKFYRRICAMTMALRGCTSPFVKIAKGSANFRQTNSILCHGIPWSEPAAWGISQQPDR